MSQLVGKKNIVIVTDTYQDQQGQQKNQYKTIGEIVTMRDDQNQVYSFGKIWGPHGVTEFKLFDQDLNRASNNMQPNGQPVTPQQMQQRQQMPQDNPLDQDIPF